MKTLFNRKPLPFLKGSFNVAFALIFLWQAPAEDEGVIKKIALPIPERLSDSDGDEDLPELDLEGMSYQELDESRNTRKLLIDYLIAEGKIRESPKGTIDFLSHLNDIGRKAVKDENQTRMQMFTLIGELEKRSFASVGREFHQQITATPKPSPKPEPKTPVHDAPPSLRISSPLSIGNSILPGLISGYLQSLGYGEVKVEKRNDHTRLIGRRSFGSGYLAVEIQGRVPGSNREPKQKCVYLETGTSAGAVPPRTIALEGLAVVVHPDNPIEALTVSQLADIFAGKIQTWDRVKGGNESEVTVLLPRARPVLVDQFRDLVLKPERENLLSIEDQPGEKPVEYLKQLTSSSTGIAFCYPREITDKVKAVRIKASSEALALYPSPINIQTLDYPLVRHVSLRAFKSSDSFIQDFINFCQSETGQASIARSGFVGVKFPTRKISDPDNHRQVLLDHPDVPDDYKDLIRDADRLNSPFNFRFVPGTANFQLTDFSQANFEQLSRYITSTGSNQKVILIGFADSQGDASKNRTYSAKRAESIADKFRERGLSNIVTSGMGEEMPIADNDDTDGRVANRRVEVWLER